MVVDIGCRAADVLAAGEAVLPFGELLQPVEPVLVGVVIGEPGVVGT
jgi:hypothetical protein